MVRLDTSYKLRKRISMADILICGESIQVHTIKANIKLCSPPHVYPKGKLSLFSIISKPNTNKLVDTIQDAYRNEFGKPATAAVLTHCKRELMHAIWCHLLDDKFMEAYINGMLVECVDGIVRRFFPRIFTYSADYPEK